MGCEVRYDVGFTMPGGKPKSESPCSIVSDSEFQILEAALQASAAHTHGSKAVPQTCAESTGTDARVPAAESPPRIQTAGGRPSSFHATPQGTRTTRRAPASRESDASPEVVIEKVTRVDDPVATFDLTGLQGVRF